MVWRSHGFAPTRGVEAHDAVAPWPTRRGFAVRGWYATREQAVAYLLIDELGPIRADDLKERLLIAW
jgi:predicted dienelactone hydrolase